VDVALPIFVLAGGEIFLALIAARVGVWVLRGWWNTRRTSDQEPRGPRGPGGGLRALAGGGQRSAGAPLREAA
jgi:hypothetical protein